MNSIDGEDNPNALPINAIELADGVWVHPDDLTYRFSRGSGPGGQSVNKLSTKAELRVSVGSLNNLSESAAGRLRTLAGQRLTQDDELVFHAQTHRSQLDNRRACLERLRQLAAQALKTPKPRKKSRPTRAMIERRLEAKRKVRDKKQRRRWRAE